MAECFKMKYLKSELVKIFTLSALGALLLFSSFVHAQSQTSYIIVHALNPESIEIGSIVSTFPEGCERNSVDIYCDNTLIGYGAEDLTSNEDKTNNYYNKPFPVSSGWHEIKVKFNGVVLTQTADLNAGETKVLVFEFERTEYDLKGYFDSIGAAFRKDLFRQETWQSYGQENTWDISPRIFRPGVALEVYAEHKDIVDKPFTFSWRVQGWAENVLNGRQFRVESESTVEITQAIDCRGSVSLYSFCDDEFRVGMVTKDAFVGIVDDVNGLFYDLINNGYIDESGMVQDAFRVLTGSSEMILDVAYERQRDAIYTILRQIPSSFNLPARPDFNKWYVQYIQDGWWAGVHLTGQHEIGYETAGIITGWYGMPDGTKAPHTGYHTATALANINYTQMDIYYQIFPFEEHWFRVPGVGWRWTAKVEASESDRGPYTRRFLHEGVLQNLEMSSVPYDLAGTGIKAGLVVEAKTDQQDYFLGDEIKIHCVVKDAYGQPTIPDNITAKLTLPDESIAAVDMSSVDIGIYEGIYPEVSQTGGYNLVVQAAKAGYIPAEAQYTFGVIGLEIYDGLDFRKGAEVSSDIEDILKILGSGKVKTVEGAAADGVTRLLLVSSHRKSGRVTFSLDDEEDGSLRALGDNFQTGQKSVTINTIDVDGIHMAFAIYQAPAHFFPKDYEGDTKKSVRNVWLSIETESFPVLEAIKLSRPALVLVHGLWSSPKMWTSFRQSLAQEIPGLCVVLADYKNSYDSYLKDNDWVLPAYVEKAKRELRKRGIVSVQVDVLAHSMGGVLTRLRAGELTYKWLDNFYQGEINKLITLDTPHWGSFVADGAIICYCRKHPLVFDIVMEIMRTTMNRSILRGAVKDLMTTSIPLKHMNQMPIDIPSHTIGGNYQDWYELKSGIIKGVPPEYLVLYWVLYQSNYDVKPYLMAGSDLVVSLDSQSGGLYWPATSLEFGHQHTAAANEEVAKEVIILLNKPPAELFEEGFLEFID